MDGKASSYRLLYFSSTDRSLMSSSMSPALWEKFIAWANKIIGDDVQHKPTRDALKYLLNQQKGLQRYCEDGRLPISNILAEHVAKTIAIPRKNFLFSDLKDGANPAPCSTALSRLPEPTIHISI